jgi:hypothetical protein
MALSTCVPPMIRPKIAGRASAPLVGDWSGVMMWKDLYLTFCGSPLRRPSSSASAKEAKERVLLGSRKLTMFLKLVQGPQSES